MSLRGISPHVAAVYDRRWFSLPHGTCSNNREIRCAFQPATVMDRRYIFQDFLSSLPHLPMTDLTETTCRTCGKTFHY